MRIPRSSEGSKIRRRIKEGLEDEKLEQWLICENSYTRFVALSRYKYLETKARIDKAVEEV